MLWWLDAHRQPRDSPAYSAAARARRRLRDAVVAPGHNGIDLRKSQWRNPA